MSALGRRQRIKACREQRLQRVVDVLRSRRAVVDSVDRAVKSIVGNAAWKAYRGRINRDDEDADVAPDGSPMTMADMHATSFGGEESLQTE